MYFYLFIIGYSFQYRNLHVDVYFCKPFFEHFQMLQIKAGLLLSSENNRDQDKKSCYQVSLVSESPVNQCLREGRWSQVRWSGADNRRHLYSVQHKGYLTC